MRRTGGLANGRKVGMIPSIDPGGHSLMWLILIRNCEQRHSARGKSSGIRRGIGEK